MDDLHHHEWDRKPQRCKYSERFTLPNHSDVSNIKKSFHWKYTNPVECESLVWDTQRPHSKYSFSSFTDLLQGGELFWPWAGPLQPEWEGSEAGQRDRPHVHRPLPRLYVLLHLARQHSQGLRPPYHHPVHHQDFRSARSRIMSSTTLLTEIFIFKCVNGKWNTAKVG